MSRAELPARLLLKQSRSRTCKITPGRGRQSRQYITTSSHQEGHVESTSKPSRELDPLTVFKPRLERKLIESGKQPIGSRRRRALLAGKTDGIPFEQLPYQCFQEARKVLLADRGEKLQKIQLMRERIVRLKAQDPAVSGGEIRKKHRLESMRQELEDLKIKADINDPIVKKKFEDGQVDMNKPIYRFLANRKWREYRRLVLMQRIQQMNVDPDVLPGVDPIMDITLYFGKKSISPGDFVLSTMSEKAPRLQAQLFEQGKKLCTIAVIDPDIPNVETDGFQYRCHFLACNIPISPLKPYLDLQKLSALGVVGEPSASSTPTQSEPSASTAPATNERSTSLSTSSTPTEAVQFLEAHAPTPHLSTTSSPFDPTTLLPWLPPYAQKGSPYHRLSIFILQQKDNTPINVKVAKKRVSRDGFKLVSFRDRHTLKAIGVQLFRTKFDEGMDGVMERIGAPGSDIELKRRKVEPLPYKRRNPSTFR